VKRKRDARIEAVFCMPDGSFVRNCLWCGKDKLDGQYYPRHGACLDHKGIPAGVTSCDDCMTVRGDINNRQPRCVVCEKARTNQDELPDEREVARNVEEALRNRVAAYRNAITLLKPKPEDRVTTVREHTRKIGQTTHASLTPLEVKFQSLVEMLFKMDTYLAHAVLDGFLTTASGVVKTRAIS
jgi:hypothetical protein